VRQPGWDAVEYDKSSVCSIDYQMIRGNQMTTYEPCHVRQNLLVPIKMHHSWQLRTTLHDAYNWRLSDMVVVDTRNTPQAAYQTIYQAQTAGRQKRLGNQSAIIKSTLQWHNEYKMLASFQLYYMTKPVAVQETTDKACTEDICSTAIFFLLKTHFEADKHY